MQSMLSNTSAYEPVGTDYQNGHARHLRRSPEMCEHHDGWFTDPHHFAYASLMSKARQLGGTPVVVDHAARILHAAEAVDPGELIHALDGLRQVSERAYGVLADEVAQRLRRDVVVAAGFVDGESLVRCALTETPREHRTGRSYGDPKSVVLFAQEDARLAAGAVLDGARDPLKALHLWEAVRGGNLALAAHLLQAGAQARARGTLDDTALHVAANCVNADMCALLLEAGVDVNARSAADDTPLLLAAKAICPTDWWRVDVGELIDGVRKFRTSAWNGHVDVCRVLLRHGADAGCADELGRTPLHLVAETGYPELVRLLLDYGAEPAPRDSNGFTPLYLAARAARDWEGRKLCSPLTGEPIASSSAAKGVNQLARETPQGQAALLLHEHVQAAKTGDSSRRGMRDAAADEGYAHRRCAPAVRRCRRTPRAFRALSPRAQLDALGFRVERVQHVASPPLSVARKLEQMKPGNSQNPAPVVLRVGVRFTATGQQGEYFVCMHDLRGHYPDAAIEERMADAPWIQELPPLFASSLVTHMFESVGEYLSWYWRSWSATEVERLVVMRPTIPADPRFERPLFSDAVGRFIGADPWREFDWLASDFETAWGVSRMDELIWAARVRIDRALSHEQRIWAKQTYERNAFEDTLRKKRAADSFGRARWGGEVGALFASDALGADVAQRDGTFPRLPRVGETCAGRVTYTDRFITWLDDGSAHLTVDLKALGLDPVVGEEVDFRYATDANERDDEFELQRAKRHARHARDAVVAKVFGPGNG
ncbi:MAG TPA: ankyrin repeat domain-containing protein [Gammaproteobacteria bacterium]|nr:ankyrin repeat domain-containing protein [Gammaproteobacteria bacterium]